MALVARNNEVRSTERKGFGTFATQEYQVGNVVELEGEAFSVIYQEDILRHLEEVNHKFEELHQKYKDYYLGLHAWYEPIKVAALHVALTRKGERPEDIDRLIRIYLIFVSNQFVTRNPSRNSDGSIRPQQTSIFLRSSKLNHSCDPNCAWSLSGFPGTIKIRACQPIGPDDELTISYLTDCSFSRHNRQTDLRQKWGFTCVCTRCQNADDEFDLMLQNAATELRLLYNVWRASDPSGHPRGRNQNGVITTERTVVMHRLQLITDVSWCPELFFALCDVVEYVARRVAGVSSPGTPERIDLEMARGIMQKALMVGRRYYDDDYLDKPMVVDIERESLNIEAQYTALVNQGL